MNLGELALICFAYGAMNADDSLGQLERRVEGNADFSKEEHRLALIHWLNQWQCRQFSLAHHDMASAGLLEWHDEFGQTLPPKREHLWELAEATLEGYADVFDSLANKVACCRATGGAKNGGRKSPVRFGPTAAAKILFVLRPKVFVAWDEPLRAGLRYGGSGHSYVEYLLRLREDLQDLREQCRAFNLELVDLPEEFGRPLSTPAQLLDEFYWATVTRGVVAPTRRQVARWLEWYSPREQAARSSGAAERGGAAEADRELVRLTVPPPPEE